MTATAKIDLCILWESELRTAARLLERAFEAADADPKDESRKNLYVEAILACRAALAGLTDERVVVILGGDHLRLRDKKE